MPKYEHDMLSPPQLIDYLELADILVRICNLCPRSLAIGPVRALQRQLLHISPSHVLMS